MKTHAEVSFRMERNSRCSCFLLMRNPTPLFSLGVWRYTAITATPEQEAFCVLQFVRHQSIVSVQRAFRPQFKTNLPSPNRIRRWYQQFQTTGYLCKGKSAGRPRVSEEGVERVSQSFLRSPKKSVRRASHKTEMLCLFGGCCETDWYGSPTVSTCCSFWNRQTTSTELTFVLRCKMQRRREFFLIVLCLVMSLRSVWMRKGTDIMCVY